MIAGLRAARRGPHPARGTAGRGRAALPPQRQHGLPELRALRAPLDRSTTSPSACAARRSPKPEITRRVGEMLELVRLSDRAKAKPRQLSGGQRQRVALARALVNLPAVLLLDEPLGALDLQLRKQMQLELKHIQREVGITFVYVTHDQEEALTMSRLDRRHERRRAAAGRQRRGRLRAAGQLVRRPVHRHLEPARGDGRARRRAAHVGPPVPARASRRTSRRAARCASRSGPRSSRSARPQTAGSASRARSSSRSTWARSRTTWSRSRPARA